MSPEVHALVGALGNPLSVSLSAGQADDLKGADELLPQIQIGTLPADKAYDADRRVIAPLQAAGKAAMIPSKGSREIQRIHDKEICKERHLIENIDCKLKQLRAIAARYGKTVGTFSPLGHPHNLAQLRAGPRERSRPGWQSDSSRLDSFVMSVLRQSAIEKGSPRSNRKTRQPDGSSGPT